MEVVCSVHELTDDVLARNYDAGSLQRGRAYALQLRVTILATNESSIFAMVAGNGRRPYRVDVGWDVTPRGVTMSDGCNCPLGGSCKHVVAAILTLRSRQNAPANWRRALAGLESALEQNRAVVALALSVAVVTPRVAAYSPALRTEVHLRPLRRSATNKWVRTNAAWNDLNPRHMYNTRVFADLDQAHVKAVQAILASSERERYGSNVVSLHDCSPRVWGLLREAIQMGVTITVEKPSGARALVAEIPASVSLDLVTTAGGLRLATALHAGTNAIDLDAPAFGLIGSPAHGAFAQTADGTLTLYGFERPLHPSIAKLIEAPPLDIPTADIDEFFDEYGDALALHGALGSSDRSVVVERNTFEHLVCVIDRPTIDSATLRWAARYRRGARATTYFVDELSMRGRDRGAEQVALRQLKLPTHLLAALVNAHGEPCATVTSGLDTITLLSEVVPWIAANTDVAIDQPVAVPQLREAVDVPLISWSVEDAPGTSPGSERGGGNDWFDLTVEVSVDGERIEFARLFSGITRGDPVLVLDSGTWLRLDRPEFTKLAGLIDEARGLVDHPESDVLRVNRFQVSLWDELEQLGIVARQSQRWADNVASLRALGNHETVNVPATLLATLRPYQQDGVDWLAFLQRNGLGGILADDMGLGKTVQAIALFLHVLETQPDARFLVVAPTSVVENWRREIAKFAPTIDVRTIRETAARRGTDMADTIGDASVVVTSYALLRIEFDEYAALEWTTLVLDEAQFVKNHQAKTYQCARRLDITTKIAVTGTPLENSVMDLWSLLSIAAPGLYPDPKRFSKVYRIPIENGTAPERLATLRRRIAPLMRRRTKDEVLPELPPKTEQVVEIELNPKHARIYQTQLQRERQKVLGLVGDMQKNRFEIFRSLTLLRQLCLDAALIDEKHESVGSAKIDRLIDDLTQIVGEGHRALVFSQFTRLLTRVKRRLDEAGIEYAYLDGRTRKREEAIARFKDGGVPVFAISLKAGGFGLNLTEADYCFVLDPWWNPATELQAIDRAHRIGQLRSVMVYRYIATDTIEEKVMQLKARKAALFSDVIDADEGALSGALSAADISGLFDLPGALPPE